MKRKSLIFIAFAAIITLSFSFISTSGSEKLAPNTASSSEHITEPLGGFISEDKL